MKAEQARILTNLEPHIKEEFDRVYNKINEAIKCRQNSIQIGISNYQVTKKLIEDGYEVTSIGSVYLISW